MKYEMHAFNKISEEQENICKIIQPSAIFIDIAIAEINLLKIHYRLKSIDCFSIIFLKLFLRSFLSWCLEILSHNTASNTNNLQ